MISGQPIEFSQMPCQRVAPTEKLSRDAREIQSISTEMEKLLKKGVIVPTIHEQGEFISPIFTRPKKDGTSRMILNLKSLNKYLSYHHFKMDSLSTVLNMVKPGCFMASMDLKDAYYSVPIATKDQKYLKFLWQGNLYKFVCFPNGLAFCPRKFTKLLKPVYAHLRQLGHLSASYIDDSYLQGDSFADCERNVMDTILLFDSLGFTIHPEKSSLIPKQEITFMGFKIDSVSMKVFPTKEKIDHLTLQCQCLSDTSMPSIREVASVLGFLISIFPAAHLGPLHFRTLDMDKTDALHTSKGNFDATMQLSEGARADLQWWITSAPSLYKSIRISQPEITLYTDASKEGWGGVLEDVKTGGHWTPEESQNHINYLEMLAVLFTVKAFHSQLLGKHILVKIDNMTAVVDIGKMGTSHSRKLNNLVRIIWDWCLDKGIWLTTAHIPGKDNILADAESRKTRRETEWALDRQIFQTAIRKIDIAPEIDLFASRLNYQLKPFVAYQPDPEAIEINAFTVCWKPYLFYAFPPFSILSQVLHKIQEEKATGLLVVPWWPTQPWWPQVMRMLIQAPLVLPKGKKTLFLPSQPDQIHPLHPKLRLLLCHLSGNHLKAEAFRSQLPSLYCSLGGKVPDSNTSLSLQNGNSTVVQGKLIHFQHL